MHLRDLKASNFRSVREQELRDCGTFNVLIGKNNSGKSNLLAAVAALFDVLTRRTLSSARTKLGLDDDFFGRNTEIPISILAQISVDEEVITGVFSRIGQEFPQVQQALPQINASDYLIVEVCIQQNPAKISYIKSIQYQACEALTGKALGGPRLLLQLDPEVAGELATREIELDSILRDISVVESRNFDSTDYQVAKDRHGTLSVLMRESFDRRVEFQRLIDRSENFEQFLQAREEFLGALRAEGDRLSTLPLTHNLNTFSGTAETVPEYVNFLLSHFSELRILQLADRRRPIGSEEAARLLQLKMSRGGGPVLKSIQQTVDSLLGVEIDAFASDQPVRTTRTARARSAAPDAELDVGNFLVQVNGSGVREALRLVLDLEFEKPHILLVEEPEIHLHPALEIAMMRHLKSVASSTQVFLTTHSTNFLDTGDMRNVYMVRNAGETEVSHLDVDAVDAELPKELGIRLSSVFMYDKLVFVEGLSDELVFRAFAQALGVNLGQENIGFVLMGSARNFTHFAAQSTLAVLTRRGVESHFILDRDERDDIQVENLGRRLGGGARLHVLARREIENYLVDAQAISTLIQDKAKRGGRRGVEPSADEILLALGSVADRLRETSVAKRVAARLCGVHRVDRAALLGDPSEGALVHAADKAIEDMENGIAQLRADIQRHVSEAKLEVDSGWERDKLSVAPGHELLDGVFQQYGLRFNKDRDCGDLAALIKTEKIPDELAALLRDIAGRKPMKR
jgi:predicted ATPase